MKIKNNLHIAMIDIFKSKHVILNIIFSILTVSVLIFIFSFSETINLYWDNSIKKSMDYRTLLVGYNPEKMTEKAAKKELKKTKYIEAVAPYSSYLITMVANEYKKDNKENGFYLVGSVDHPVDIVDGEDLSKYGIDDKVMICSKNFYPYFEDREDQYDRSNYIDLSKSIGKNMSLSFLNSSVEETFKLVGIYDNNQISSIGNTCYTKWNTVDKLNLKYQSDVYEEKEDEYLPLVVVVDKVENIQNVINSFSPNEFNTSGPVVKVDTYIGDKILNIVTITSIILIILLIILSIFISLKDIKIKNKKIGILKTFGYTNQNILISKILEEIIKDIIILLLSIPISIIFLNLFQIIYINSHPFLNGLLLKVTSKSILSSTITIIVSSIFIIFVHYKKMISIKNADILGN